MSAKLPLFPQTAFPKPNKFFPSSIIFPQQPLQNHKKLNSTPSTLNFFRTFAHAKSVTAVNTEKLFLIHYRPLCLYALHILGDIDKAEDAVQDAFLALLENHSDCTPPLLFRTVRNRCIDILRQQKSHPTLSIAATEPLTKEDPLFTDHDADFYYSAARLWTAIDALPDRCRQAFLMAKRDGMSYREIAEELGISERTVEHQVSKALHLLRQQKSVFFRLLLFL